MFDEGGMRMRGTVEMQDGQLQLDVQHSFYNTDPTIHFFITSFYFVKFGKQHKQ